MIFSGGTPQSVLFHLLGSSHLVTPRVEARMPLSGEKVNPRRVGDSFQQRVKFRRFFRMPAPSSGETQLEFFHIRPLRSPPAAVQDEFAIVIRQSGKLDSLRLLMPYHHPPIGESPILNQRERPAKMLLGCPQEKVAVRRRQSAYRQRHDVGKLHQRIAVGDRRQLLIFVANPGVRPRRVNHDDRIPPPSAV